MDQNIEKLIPLTKGKFTLVDSEDFNFLNQWKWYFGVNGYARRCQQVSWDGKKQITKAISLHRFIVKAPKNMDVDHINGNKLDNRKSNLRLCSRSQNCQNRKIRKDSKSKIKGVYFQDNKWVARLGTKTKYYYLGGFDDKKQASIAYNKAAQKYFREFARLNQI